MEITHLPASASGSEIAEALRRDGAVIVDELVAPDVIDRFFAEMQPHVDATPLGGDDFAGRTTRRTGGLLARSATSQDLVMHPTVISTCDDFLAEIDEVGQEIPECERFWPATVQSKHVASERRLHLTETPKLVKDNIRRCISLKLDHNAYTNPIALVLNAGDTFDLFLADKISDAFDHRRFVHLIGNFVDDDRITILANFFDSGL